MTTQTPTSGIKLNAVVAGGVAFIAVYALGLIAIVLVYSVIGASALQDALVLTLRIAAWPALAFPAWLAARVAGHSGWLHGLLFGVVQGLIVVVLMTQSFSWVGTLRAEVTSSMLPAFALVFSSALLGGGFGEWQNRRLG